MPYLVEAGGPVICMEVLRGGSSGGSRWPSHPLGGGWARGETRGCGERGLGSWARGPGRGVQGSHNEVQGTGWHELAYDSYGAKVSGIWLWAKRSGFEIWVQGLGKPGPLLGVGRGCSGVVLMSAVGDCRDRPRWCKGGGCELAIQAFGCLGQTPRAAAENVCGVLARSPTSR